MKILYIGGGFVGACSAAVSADSGHEVLVFDVDVRKIAAFKSGDKKAIESFIFEEGLAEMIAKNKDRISFTNDYSDVQTFVNAVDAIFMCVPTPEVGETGESDLRYYHDACNKLAEALATRNNKAQGKYVVVVNKSTVPVEMVDQTEKILKNKGVINFGVVSNPEFLVEGKAVEGSVHPDRVVVGAWNEADFKIMRDVYARFVTSTGVAYIEVNPKEAAAGKLLANFYLFNKLAVCFDVIGRASETFTNVAFENIRKIMTSDPRIGSWGFYDSLYAGGSCFIKDARSLAHQMQTAGASAVLINETYLANRRQLELFLGRAEKEAGFNWSGKKVAILGLAFKQDTNDIRNSPSLDIVPFLREHSVQSAVCYDPTASDMFKRVFPESDTIRYAPSEREAMVGADVIIVATDWPQFRVLGDEILKSAKPDALIMDGRRMLAGQYNELVQRGHTIIAVGSPLYKK